MWCGNEVLHSKVYKIVQTAGFAGFLLIQRAWIPFPRTGRQDWPLWCPETVVAKLANLRSHPPPPTPPPPRAPRHPSSRPLLSAVDSRAWTASTGLRDHDPLTAAGRGGGLAAEREFPR
eukprot:gene16167-biopygen15799